MIKSKLARLGALALAGTLVATMAACAPASDTPEDSSGTGGTITYLGVGGQWEGADPASVYYGNEIAAFRRLVYRGLVAFPIDDPDTPPVADLATDAGTTDDGGLTWTFTIKDDVTWQDGSPITGEDFVYGLSRSFDPTLVNATGVGTAYLGSYASSVVEAGYEGPFTSTPEAQAVFDEHFSADGQTVTYKFDQAWADFPLSAASLLVTDPYQKSFDDGSTLWAINSNGPYKLDGDELDGQSGGTFVRNENYDPASDSTELRQALPDEFIFEFVSDTDVLFQRLLSEQGDDSAAFADLNIPASFYSQITGDVEARSVKSDSPYTRFLEINSLTVTDPKVRRAMSIALNREGVLGAYGGENYGKVSSSIMSTGLTGYEDNPTFSADAPAGDPEAAKALLAEAGTPNPEITFAFADSPTNQTLAPVIEQSLEAAGFQVSLSPISPDATPGYYGQMSDRSKNGQKVDLFLAGWAADWPSASTVVAPILLSNPEGAESGVGFNYGFYSNPDVDALIKQGQAEVDPDAAASLYAQADAAAAADGAYVPMVNQSNYFLYGSRVKNFEPTAASNFYPDFGKISVAE